MPLYRHHSFLYSITANHSHLHHVMNQRTVEPTWEGSRRFGGGGCFTSSRRLMALSQLHFAPPSGLCRSDDHWRLLAACAKGAGRVSFSLFANGLKKKKEDADLSLCMLSCKSIQGGASAVCISVKVTAGFCCAVSFFNQAGLHGCRHIFMFPPSKTRICCCAGVNNATLVEGFFCSLPKTVKG